MSATTDRLTEELPGLMAHAHVPGVSIAAVAGGEVAWRGGFGLLHASKPGPVTDETRFQAASLSKPVFAYAVLHLVELGLLDLDVPLTNYLSEPFVADDDGLGRVTARHVLSHTTGWPNWRPSGQPLRREAPAGERFGYSGEGFVYLQRAVEHVLDEPLETLMQSGVLQPFGMERSSFEWPGGDELAAAHDGEGMPLETRESSWQPNAAYSLHSTPSDLARFVAEVIRGPRGMLEPQVRVNDRVSWALGWGLESSGEGRAFWHWGDNRGFKSFAIGLPDAGSGAVVMTNGDDGRRLCAWVVQRLLGTDHPALEWLARHYEPAA